MTNDQFDHLLKWMEKQEKVNRLVFEQIERIDRNSSCLLDALRKIIAASSSLVAAQERK